MIYLEININ